MMKYQYLLCFVLLIPALPALAAEKEGEPLVWQLGRPDGASTEFRIPYHAWEYGLAPEIRASQAMDHKTDTFQYEIESAGAIPSPILPAGIVTPSSRWWMNNDEMLTGVKFRWDEAQAGNRRIVISCASWSNPQGGVGAVEVSLPGGAKKIFELPRGVSKKGEPHRLEVVFPVPQGQNELTIRIASQAKHCSLQFDCIKLRRTNAPSDLVPLLECGDVSSIPVHTPGEMAAFNVRSFNLKDGKGSVQYVITDAFGQTMGKGSVALCDSTAQIVLPTSTRGWFRVDCTMGEAHAQACYVVLEPVKLEYVDDSRFGCHAICPDSYRLNYWPEYQETMMQRAFLAGAKWVRHHSIHWFLREPEKGKYDWTYFDDRLTMAERYKLRVLLTFNGTPLWASSSDSKKMTCCGTYYYQENPPKDFHDWSNFIATVVGRYKGRIQWYELWNEPGYTSAFWCNGSAKAFGELLRTGYEAAKKTDPNCVVLSGAPTTPDFLDEAVRSAGGKRLFDVMSIHYAGDDKRGGALFLKWKDTLRRLGMENIPFVNTEEMAWAGKHDEVLAFSSALVKTYVHEAALGYVKTFAFDFFRNGSIFNASSFDLNGNPQPQYAAYRTMTHRLEHARFVADLSTAETEVYLFDRQGTPVLVLWSETGRPIELPVGDKNARLVNIMDVESSATVQNGIIQMQGMKTPIFVEGGDLSVLTTFGKELAKFPPKIDLRPGEQAERSVLLDADVSDVRLTLPASWRGTFHAGKLSLQTPCSTMEGIYDAKASFRLPGGIECFVPFLVEISSGTPETNLIRNGDFQTDWFFSPILRAKIQKNGRDGRPVLKTTGTVYFGCDSGIKVRPGEQYVVFVDAKGTGFFGGVYTLRDKDGRKIFPATSGINVLNGKLETGWKRFHDVIRITQPTAVQLKFNILANYGDTKNKKVAFFGQVGLMRLTERFTVSKAIYQGICFRIAKGESIPWATIPAMTADHLITVGNSNLNKSVLSATCQMAMDPIALHLRFTVKGKISPPTNDSPEQAWRHDSVQFAIDPTLEGKDRTEILVGRNAAGKAFAYKYSNFFTPELPENITRNGLMKDVQASIVTTHQGMIYEIEIPLCELYPLKNTAESFGFSWLVNNDPGQGRIYAEWSEGIGGAKMPSRFGLVRCQNAPSTSQSPK